MKAAMLFLALLTTALGFSPAQASRADQCFEFAAGAKASAPRVQIRQRPGAVQGPIELFIGSDKAFRASASCLFIEENLWECESDDDRGQFLFFREKNTVYLDSQKFAWLDGQREDGSRAGTAIPCSQYGR